MIQKNLTFHRHLGLNDVFITMRFLRYFFWKNVMFNFKRNISNLGIMQIMHISDVFEQLAIIFDKLN